VGGKSAGNRPHVFRQRAWADCRIRGGDVKRFGLGLPERKPGGLFLLEVLCDRRAREVEPGRANLRVKARESMCPSTAIFSQRISEILHVSGMSKLAFGGDVSRNALGKVEQEKLTLGDDEGRGEAAAKPLPPE
jgi:hypothetical protein